jgi:hypothetical protein
MSWYQGLSRLAITRTRSEERNDQDMATRMDQVDNLLDAREAEPDLGFMARMLTLCSLPRTDPGARTHYKRINGPYRLFMNAGTDNRLPYGSIPRLLLAWVATESVRTRKRDLVLGRSLSRFMRELGVHSDSGGKRGELTRFREQMIRLFGCTISLVYEGREGYCRVSSLVADRHEFWWDPKRPDQSSLWESRIELGEKFFNEIIRNPVPLDMNVLKALKRSPLGLDLYLWLNYRTFSLKQPIRLPWRRLYRQFGREVERTKERIAVDNFRKKCLRELKKIRTACPNLDCSTARGMLIVTPPKSILDQDNASENAF